MDKFVKIARKDSKKRWEDFAIMLFFLSLSLLSYLGSIANFQSISYLFPMGITILLSAVILLIRNEEIPEFVRLIPLFSYCSSALMEWVFIWKNCGKEATILIGIKCIALFAFLSILCFVRDVSDWKVLQWGLLSAVVLFSGMNMFFVLSGFRGFAVPIAGVDGMTLWNKIVSEAFYCMFFMHLIRPREYQLNETVFWRNVRFVIYSFVEVAGFLAAIAVLSKEVPNYREFLAMLLSNVSVWAFLAIWTANVFGKEALYCLDEEKVYQEYVSSLLEWIDSKKDLATQQIKKADEVTAGLLRDYIGFLKKEEILIRSDEYTLEELSDLLVEIEKDKKSLKKSGNTQAEEFKVDDSRTMKEILEEERIYRHYQDVICELLCRDKQSNYAVVQLGEYLTGRIKEIDPDSRMILFYAGLLCADGSCPGPVGEIIRKTAQKGQ